jgi:AcrR family transcriptional regulator
MRAPSLYSHFPSKEAIYDAMFADAWATCLAYMQESDSHLPTAPRARLRAMARSYVEFACADLPRHQIMDVRTIPDFEPSPASNAVSAQCYRRMTAELGTVAVTRSAAIDMYTAMLAGIIEQQLANDPGGRRWIKLVPRMVDMYADALRIPVAAPTRQRAR